MQVTIVLSSPRSGSSWLSRVVRCIPDHCVFTHNTFTTQFLYLLYPFRSANAWGDDGICRRKLTDTLIDPLRIRSMRSHIAKKAAGKPVILLSPTLSNYSPLISRVFPDARYVHFQRNPLDTIASMKKFLAKNDCGGFLDRYREHFYGGRIYATRSGLVHVGHKFRWRNLIHPGYLGVRPTGFQSATKLSLVQFLSWYYSANQRDIVTALAQVPESRQIDMHYEQLVGDYDNSMARLLDFIIGPHRDFETPLSHDGVKQGTIGRRKQTYSAEELKAIRNFIIDHAPEKVLKPYGLDREGSKADDSLVGSGI
ncbi:MAG: sulfotransferase [Pirellulaceae bacterium]|nr:sulfotransferase [Pirellulaceae bacterium]